MKLLPTIQARPHPTLPSWQLELRGLPYELKDIAKQVPGVAWHPALRVWACAEDALHELSAHLQGKCLLSVPVASIEPDVSELEASILGGLHEHQSKGIARALRTGPMLFNWPTGAGKTPAAIRYCDAAKLSSILVVCPAIARGVWAAHIRDWATLGSSTVVIRKGKDWENVKADTRWVVTSYELFDKGGDLAGRAILCDESHLLANRTSARTEAVQGAVSDGALCHLLLSGTPIANRPLNLWAQLNILYLGRYGSYWTFAKWFFEVEEGEYGMVIGGLRPERAAAFQQRLALVSDQVLRSDIQHLFPGVIFEVDVVASRRRKPIDTTKALDESEFVKALEEDSAKKTDEVLRHVEHAFETGRTHVCILTHRKASVREYAKLVSRRFSVPTFEITGEVAEAKRHSLLDTAKSESRAVVVATMHSINVAIDLTRFTYAIFAELYWQPGIVAQAAGRFDRISGTDPATIVFVVVRGRQEEAVAIALQRKLQEQQRLMRLGGVQTALSAPIEMGADEWQAEIAAVAAQTRDEVY